MELLLTKPFLAKLFFRFFLAEFFLRNADGAMVVNCRFDETIVQIRKTI